MKSPVLDRTMSFRPKASLEKKKSITKQQKEIIHKDVARGGEKCGAGQQIFSTDMRPVTVESVTDFDSPKIILTSADSTLGSTGKSLNRSKDVLLINKAWEKKKSNEKQEDTHSIPRSNSIVVKVKPAARPTLKRQSSSRQSRADFTVKVKTEDIPVGQRYEDYFKYKKSDEEEYGVKPRWFTPRMKFYCRKMGCGTSNQIASLEDTMPVVVFGATGMIGGAVARALLKDHRFTVRAVTRTPTTDQARALAEEGAVVVPADLNDSRSLQRVMEGAAGVFLTTNYWEHLSKQKEITHGMNAIDAAVSCNVHHFVFQGSEPTPRDRKSCGHMDAKAAIEEYVKETTLPYTAIHNPFLYENLLSIFKPHCVRSDLYTVPIPMEDKPLDCMALHDYARCVVNIFLRPKNHMMKSVKLTGDRMHVKHIADVLNRHFDDRKVLYHQISPKDFSEFDFQGSHDLSAMFEFLQSAPPRDARITRRIHGSVMCFDRWVTDNKAKLTEVMKNEEHTS